MLVTMLVSHVCLLRVIELRLDFPLTLNEPPKAMMSGIPKIKRRYNDLREGFTELR